jgi:hypothetical protein
VQDAADVQRRTLLRLLRRAAPTAFGRAHGFAGIGTVAQYQRAVPLRTYEAFWREWWEPAFPLVGGVTWPGKIRYFVNSSGTTSGTTKRIPLSMAMMRGNSLAGLDMLGWHFQRCPGSRIAAGKNVFLGGTTALEQLAPGIEAGDLSGVVAKAQPMYARGRALPPPEVSCLSDWREKMARLAPLALAADVRSVSGTASWMLLFFEACAALRPPGARLRDLFPNLELLVHGGVGFDPYRPRFAEWMEGSRALTREAYAASEGFVAMADRGDGEGLRLVLDRGLFFEFVRPEELGLAKPDRRWIADAELDVEYALVLTTNAGLWSYVIGDTVRLASRDPPRILVTGRTSWFLSVVGEHLIGAELDRGMAEAAAAVGRRVMEYSAAPIQPDEHDSRGGHLFAVELDGPADPAVFGAVLDTAFKRMNEDYAAHRGDGFGLRDPVIRLLPPGSFERWMERRGKLGAQNKVPRVVASVQALSGLLAI